MTTNQHSSEPNLLILSPSPDGDESFFDHDPGRMTTVPARVRPLSKRDAAEFLGQRDAESLNDSWYWFTAEISSTTLDSYYSHMEPSTLRNFAKDAAGGVALLDSHNRTGAKLGVGYSAGGRYEEENGAGRAIGLFYIIPGIRFGGQHSFASTDDYIRAIEGEVIRDVSVGFYEGRWVCDLCRQPYVSRRSTCTHWAGEEYEIEVDGKMSWQVCTVAIHDARLSEVSLVYDGATPGAMILKAEQEAEAGRLTPEMTQRLERQYRVKLPPARRTVRVASDSAAGIVITNNPPSPLLFGTATNVTASGIAGAKEKRTMEEEPTLIEQEETVTENAAPAGEAERALLAEIRQALTESAAPDGMEIVATVRWLNEQLAQATQERDAARQETARLQPLADQGRAYREDMINQAVVEGVRALGEAFPEETYRAMLANAPLEHIRQVRDTFGEQAAARFPGGRQTRDANETEPERPAVPTAAYGAQVAGRN